jgi:ATP-dependent DNA helicase RecG
MAANGSPIPLFETDGDRNAYLKPALAVGVIEMTLPDKPRSSNQRYRLTTLGQRWLETHAGTQCNSTLS